MVAWSHAGTGEELPGPLHQPRDPSVGGLGEEVGLLEQESMLGIHCAHPQPAKEAWYCFFIFFWEGEMFWFFSGFVLFWGLVTNVVCKLSLPQL